MKRDSVFFIARDEVKAVRVLDDLKEAGFPLDTISVLVPEQGVAGGFNTVVVRDADWPPTRAAILNGAFEELDDVGILTRPGLGRVMGAGRLMVGFNAPIAASGMEDTLNELLSIGVPPKAAENYEKCLGEGKILMSVACDDSGRATHLERLLKFAGADYVAWSAPGSLQVPVDGDGCYEEAA